MGTGTVKSRLSRKIRDVWSTLIKFMSECQVISLVSNFVLVIYNQPRKLVFVNNCRYFPRTFSAKTTKYLTPLKIRSPLPFPIHVLFDANTVVILYESLWHQGLNITLVPFAVIVLCYLYYYVCIWIRPT